MCMLVSAIAVLHARRSVSCFGSLHSELSSLSLVLVSGTKTDCFVFCARTDFHSVWQEGNATESFNSHISRPRYQHGGTEHVRATVQTCVSDMLVSNLGRVTG